MSFFLQSHDGYTQISNSETYDLQISSSLNIFIIFSYVEVNKAIILLLDIWVYLNSPQFFLECL